MSCRHCSVFDRWLVFCKFFNKEKLLIYYLLINCMLLQKRGTGHRQVIPPLSLVVFGCLLFAFFFLIVWALWLTADKGLAHNSFPLSDLRAEERCTFVLAWEGTPRNSWWGCAARFSKSWPYFRLKNVIFPHPFSDLMTPKIHTRFQTWPLGRNYHNVIIT